MVRLAHGSCKRKLKRKKDKLEGPGVGMELK